MVFGGEGYYYDDNHSQPTLTRLLYDIIRNNPTVLIQFLDFLKIMS